MTTDNKAKSSLHSQLPLVNSDDVHTQKIYSVLPFFGFINMTISSGTTIYRAYNNNDIPMVVFITFVYFGSFLLDYWLRLYHKLPPSEQSSKRRNVKIGIWVLLSAIMLGFACEFSTFMSLNQSMCFFGVVIGGNSFLFYVYFIWEGDKSGSTCSITSGGTCREAHDIYSCCKSGNADEMEYKPLTEGTVDNV